MQVSGSVWHKVCYFIPFVVFYIVLYHFCVISGKWMKSSNETVTEPSRDMTKPVKWVFAKRGLRPVCSESSLCAAWVAKDPSFLHAESQDFDQTELMSWPWGDKTWGHPHSKKAQWLAACGHKWIAMICCLWTQIKRNGWLLADTCPQAANHCALFLACVFSWRTATFLVFRCRGSFVLKILMRIEDESVSSFISLCVSKSYQTKLSIIEITWNL